MSHVLAQDLRNAVLQAAMSGRLTQQLDTDSLISVPEIQDDYEKPFEIPDNWKFVYLGDVFNIRSSSRVHQADWRSEGVPFYRAREVVKLSENGFVNNELFIDEELYDRFSKTSGVPHPGDLLVSGVGTLGATYIVKDTDRFYYKDASVLCFENINKQNSQFAKYLLQTPYMIQQIYDPSAFGTTVATLTMKRANLFVVALPPVEEQARIVARVDELMAKIDEYEKIEKELTELQKAFPGNMKDAILQAAMQGKLTEQLESDGDVYEYLDDIASLKASLIQEKKLKKDKTTDIVEDEYPFDIPDSWAWTKFGAIANLRPGKTPPRAEPTWWGDKNDVPWVSIADMIADGHVSKTKEFISQAGFKEKFKESISPAGTMIMSFKLTVGRVSYLDIDALHNEAIISIFPFKDDNNILQSYLFMVLPYLTKYGDSKNAIKGTTLNEDSLCNLYIPLPPFKEQQRIVDKLDQLLPLCEQLEKMAA